MIDFTRKLPLLILSFMLSSSIYAGDDPSIRGDLRSNVQKSMSNYIDHQSIDGRMYVYDAVDGKLLKLKLEKLHSGIVKKGKFYVSCADFIDQKDRKIDIDFMVRLKAGELITTQALVHSVDGDKRKYHLEKL